MKKFIVSLIVAVLIAACMREQTNIVPNQNEANRVILIPSVGKSTEAMYLMINIGHDGSNCNGCIYFGGKYIHKDCMGRGNYCHPVAQVNLNIDGTDISVTTVDTFGLTTEDFFLMPDRSLNYTDENNNRIYLNIPEQLVYRDNTTQQFTFTGLFFSNTAAYTND